jgi:hypothetical protein
MIVNHDQFFGLFLEREAEDLGGVHEGDVLGTEAEEFYEHDPFEVGQADDPEMFLVPADFVLAQQNLLHDPVHIIRVQNAYPLIPGQMYFHDGPCSLI